MSDRRPSDASLTLLAAALGGLLSVAGCGADSTESNGDGTVTLPKKNGDSPDPSTACASGVLASPGVTSSKNETLTKDAFTSLCDAQKGIFETQPNCGGSNACRGFSYDSETETLTEHTCRATNSCAGYSCVVCD